MVRAWWDEVSYRDQDIQPQWSMTVEASEEFIHPCGFVRLRERHRVKAPSRQMRVEVGPDAADH